MSEGVTTMPWGRHKGVDIREVPSDYLQWALDEADALTDDLRAAIKTELRERVTPPGTTALPGFDGVPF